MTGAVAEPVGSRPGEEGALWRIRLAVGRTNAVKMGNTAEKISAWHEIFIDDGPEI
jgi:hypothetical protein